MWGTALDLENVVWGTMADLENIVWGTSGADEDGPMYDDPDGTIGIFPLLPDEEISISLTLMPAGGGL